jgi:DNA-binding response OmpR family regulator
MKATAISPAVVGRRVLVIDDEETVRNVIRDALQFKGFVVAVAADGIEGLRDFRAEPAEVVICDMLMPEKEGIETIHDLRQEWPEVKIIAMSGGGMSGSMDGLKFAKRLGADATLAKPFSMDELFAAVDRLLSTEPVADGPGKQPASE